MDFFEHQQLARRQTRLMVLLFVLSTVCIIAVINLVGGWIYLEATGQPLFPPGPALAKVPAAAWWITSIVVLFVILAGSAKRMLELSDGGPAVARMVGARAVRRDTQDPMEKRLLNTIEEMAIASGITVPHAYVIDDQPGINAFAAGYSPNEAVIAVTRGALDALSRDELQGVIGHEFSHILNGDMRLNVRLLGVIAGLVAIGTAGRFLMQVDSKARDKDGNSSRLALVGLVIFVVGWIGVLFGNLIKAAIARQREFLADASSVQITRNPDGIAGALTRIMDTSALVRQEQAEELSHMFIAEPVAHFSSFETLFATHPPLEERITRVLGPRAAIMLRERARGLERAKAPPAPPAGLADGMPEQVVALATPLAADAPPPAQDFASRLAEGISLAPDAKAPVRATPAQVLGSVGRPTPGHYEYARRLLALIPPDVRNATGDADGARAVLCALLLGTGDVRTAQLEFIAGKSNPVTAHNAARHADAIAPLGARLRMPLFDLVTPTLQRLEAGERETLLAIVRGLIDADHRISLGEFVLWTLCQRHFGGAPQRPPPVKHADISAVATEATMVLSLLAQSGRGGKPAFDKGMAELGLAGAMRALQELGVAACEAALYELKLLAPLKKPQLIKGCLAVVMADGTLTVAEGEIMRAICAAIDSPLPPLIDHTEPAA